MGTSNETVRVYAIKRRPIEERWDRKMIMDADYRNDQMVAPYTQHNPYEGDSSGLGGLYFTDGKQKEGEEPDGKLFPEEE